MMDWMQWFGVFGAVLIAIVSSADAQKEMNDSTATNGFQVSAIQDGFCQCTLRAPIEVVCTDYGTRQTSDRLSVIQDQIVNLTLDVTDLYEVSNKHKDMVDDFKIRLANVILIFHRIDGGQLTVTRDEIDGIRLYIESMTSSLLSLENDFGREDERAQVFLHLLKNISQIGTVVESIINQNADSKPYGLISLQRRVTELARLLEACGDSRVDLSVNDDLSTHRQPDPVPTSSRPTGGPTLDKPDWRWPVNAKQDSCRKLVAVSEPYTLRGNLPIYGTWMRDPIVNQQLVYYYNFSRELDDEILVEYDSPTSFQRSKARRQGPNLEGVHTAIALNGSVFAYVEETRRVQQYEQYYHRNRYVQREFKLLKRMSLSGELGNERVLGQNDAPLNLHHYLNQVISAMDFAVDESGLWLLYGNSDGMLSVSKVNQDTLDFETTFNEGSYPKNRLGNCFVICQKVYCLNSAVDFDSRLHYHIDIQTGLEGFMKVPFIIKYGDLSSIKYNPYDQLLYGWDNGHAVVYSLTFE